jgi:hypothetical protein
MIDRSSNMPTLFWYFPFIVAAGMFDYLVGQPEAATQPQPARAVAPRQSNAKTAHENLRKDWD